MIRIGILGDIGSGKSYVAYSFGYPVFNADYEVIKLYKNNRKVFLKLKKKLPKFVTKFPLDKSEIIHAIMSNNINLSKITNIVHQEITVKLKSFLKKNKNKKIVILDIPLLLENKINIKNDILVFVDAQKKDIKKRLVKRKNFNLKLFKKFKKIQLSLDYKKKKSNFIIKNKFTKISIKNSVREILHEIL